MTKENSYLQQAEDKTATQEAIFGMTTEEQIIAA